MMDINRHNYQVWAMEYIENTLPEDLKKEFDIFLSENKDIASEIALLKEFVPVLSADTEVFPDKNELRTIASKNRTGKAILLRASGGVAAAAAIAILALSGVHERAENTPSAKIATRVEVPAEREIRIANNIPVKNEVTAGSESPATKETPAANKTPAINEIAARSEVPVAVRGNKATAAIQNREEEPFPAIMEGTFELPAPVLSSPDFELPAQENTISLCDLKTGFYPEHNITAQRMNNNNIIGELSRASRTAALILASIDSMLPIRKLETESETVYHIASIAIVRTSNK